jgi:Rrf2 family protein
MMELTRKGEYAIRGIVFLAKQPAGKVVLVSEVAEATGVSHSFLAKIFQSFAKLGLVNSFRGTGGGFLLGRPASRITLRQVVEAVEGPIIPNRCLTEEGSCNREAECTVHPIWRKIQGEIASILDAVTLEDLAKEKK